MSTGHWFRMYDDVLDNPKVQRLPGPLFKAWVNVLALSSKNGGRLPKAMADVGFGLRISEREAGKLVAELHGRRLLDKDDEGYFPHDWEDRQYKSDTTAERMKRYRERNKNRNDDRNALRNGDGKSDVLDTDTDTDSETEQNREEGTPSLRSGRAREGTLIPFQSELVEIPPCLDRRAKTQGTRWGPDDLVPPDWLDAAESRCREDGLPTPDLRREAGKFERYWSSRAGKAACHLDWKKTFINWIIKAAEDGQNKRGGRRESHHEQAARVGAELIAEFDARDRPTDRRPAYGSDAALRPGRDDGRGIPPLVENLLRGSGSSQ